MDSDNRTFRQRMGVHPLPVQLDIETIPRDFRAIVWARFHHFILRNSPDVTYDVTRVRGPALELLKGYFVFIEHQPIDEFSNKTSSAIKYSKRLIMDADWSETMEFINFILRSTATPDALKAVIVAAMEKYRLAYRFIDGRVCPIASTEHAQAIEAAHLALNEQKYVGAAEHLGLASAELSAGRWAASIRESIHAVESVVRQIEPTENDFAPALSKIEKRRPFHPALKAAFGKLYGYTSNEAGIRHSIVDEPKGQIDEPLALFMNHACVSAISFLIAIDRSS